MRPVWLRMMTIQSPVLQGGLKWREVATYMIRKLTVRSCRFKESIFFVLRHFGHIYCTLSALSEGDGVSKSMLFVHLHQMSTLNSAFCGPNGWPLDNRTLSKLGSMIIDLKLDKSYKSFSHPNSHPMPLMNSPLTENKP